MSKFRLMKGDCLKRLKEIPDKSVDMILCDPPYGTTACKWDVVIPFEPMWNELKRITKDSVHPTQKPVALLEYLVKTYTLENETVLDFTMGSGSTGVACKNLKRNFIGIEKEDKYYKIAVDRIKNFNAHKGQNS